MEKSSFVFFETFEEKIRLLPEHYQLVIYKMITNFGLYGITPDFESVEDSQLLLIMRLIWVDVENGIENSKERRTVQIENGKKGGAPKGNSNAKKQPNSTENNPIQPKTTENNLNVNVNDNVNVNVDVDVKDEVQEVLSELFETEKPFTDDFETTTTTFFQKNNINKIEYCHFVYDYAKKVCSQNKNINLKGFYYKHFADNDILAEYQSRIKQKDLDKQKELSNFEHCPICGKSIDRRLFRSCPDCNFGIEHFGEVAEVEKHKKFMKLSKQVQEDYTQKKDDLLTKFMIKQLNKTEFAQKVDELERNYGLIA